MLRQAVADGTEGELVVRCLDIQLGTRGVEYRELEQVLSELVMFAEVRTQTQARQVAHAIGTVEADTHKYGMILCLIAACTCIALRCRRCGIHIEGHLTATVTLDEHCRERRYILYRIDPELLIGYLAVRYGRSGNIYATRALRPAVRVFHCSARSRVGIRAITAGSRTAVKRRESHLIPWRILKILVIHGLRYIY